jgi:hypothetical protein
MQMQDQPASVLHSMHCFQRNDRVFLANTDWEPVTTFQVPCPPLFWARASLGLQKWYFPVPATMHLHALQFMHSMCVQCKLHALLVNADKSGQECTHHKQKPCRRKALVCHTSRS